MKILLLVIFMFVSLGAYSQFGQPQVVIDPSSIEKLKEYIEIGKQTQKTLQDAQDILSQVSSAVTSARQIKETIALQKQAYEYASKISSAKFYNTKIANDAIGSATDCITKITTYIGDLNKILSSNFFKMTDKERLDYLEKTKDLVFMKTKRLQRIIMTYDL